MADEVTLLGQAGEEKPAGDEAAAAEKAVEEAKAAEEVKRVEGLTDEEKAAEEAKRIEGLTDEEKAAEKVAADEKAKGEGAPEKYEDFTFPEGTQIDETALADFKVLAKEEGLTQEQAQKYAGFYAEQMDKAATAQVELWNKTRNEWIASAKGDDEIGGDKMEVSLKNAALAVKKFGTPGLNEFLETYGGGNHPEVVRFCSRIGAAMSEGGMITGDAPQSDASAASKIFPSMKA